MIKRPERTNLSDSTRPRVGRRSLIGSALGGAVGAALVVLAVFYTLRATTEGEVPAYGVARAAGLIAAAIVAGGGAVIAYRKQRSTEQSQDHTEWHDRDEAKREREADLRSRYTAAGGQLAHESFAVRLAGVYALGSLADDWHTFGNDDERQVCVSLLCAYLRTGRRPVSLDETDEPVTDHEEVAVRNAIVELIRTRTQRNYEHEWDSAGINLFGADLAEAILHRANLSDADLRDADLRDADLRDADLRGANLSGADLRGANLHGARLDKADLTLAWLGKAFLFGADLAEAILHSTMLHDADFRGANLSGADLRCALFSGARLHKADLSATDLRSADLRGATLAEADLGGATLAGTHVRGADLSSCTYDEGTAWPEGFTPPDEALVVKESR